MRRLLVVAAVASGVGLGAAIAAPAQGQTCVTACQVKAERCARECTQKLRRSFRSCEMECARTLFVPCFQRCSQDGTVDYDDYEIEQPQPGEK
jgi:hypothetical protein